MGVTGYLVLQALLVSHWTMGGCENPASLVIAEQGILNRQPLGNHHSIVCVYKFCFCVDSLLLLFLYSTYE